MYFWYSMVVASVLHELLVLDELVDVGKLLEGFELAERGNVKEVTVKGARHDEVGVWESRVAEGWGGEWLGAGSNHPHPPPKNSLSQNGLSQNGYGMI